uniref:Secreted protein n=1 Tax=Steinernema glaseri TaxID=37863 RepID=A0A1I7ZPY9_9BILA
MYNPFVHLASSYSNFLFVTLLEVGSMAHRSVRDPPSSSPHPDRRLVRLYFEHRDSPTSSGVASEAAGRS